MEEMKNAFLRIQTELSARGDTLAWFAEQLGESTQNINNWKNRGVPAKKLREIAKILNVSRDYLEGVKPPAHDSDLPIQVKELLITCRSLNNNNLNDLATYAEFLLSRQSRDKSNPDNHGKRSA
jgi:transcriptional regulator with XRE-family HTH domain